MVPGADRALTVTDRAVLAAARRRRRHRAEGAGTGQFAAMESHPRHRPEETGALRPEARRVGVAHHGKGTHVFVEEEGAVVEQALQFLDQAIWVA